MVRAKNSISDKINPGLLFDLRQINLAFSRKDCLRLRTGHPRDGDLDNSLLVARGTS